MTRRGATAGVAAAAITGGILIGALGALVPSGADAAWAASDCDRDWSVSHSDGSSITTSALFADELIAPGASLNGDFVVTTGRDIRGPLELRAVRTGDESELTLATESEILITLTGPSRTVTLPLNTLLDATEPMRLVDALSAGTHAIGITAQLPFESTNSSQLHEIPFQLVVTVSDSETVVGGEVTVTCPTVPGGVDSGGGSSAGGATSGSGDPSNLASTGAQAGANVAWAAALLGAGFAAVFAARRRRRTTAKD